MNKTILVLMSIFFTATSYAATETCKFTIEKEVGEIIVQSGLSGGPPIGVASYNGIHKVMTAKIARYSAKKSNFAQAERRTGALTFAANLGLDISQAALVRVVMLDPKKNKDELLGASIATFLDAKGNIVQRFGQIGMGGGVCQ
jgi:hypothetical protein